MMSFVNVVCQKRLEQLIIKFINSYNDCEKYDYVLYNVYNKRTI